MVPVAAGAPVEKQTKNKAQVIVGVTEQVLISRCEGLVHLVSRFVPVGIAILIGANWSIQSCCTTGPTELVYFARKFVASA
jgi:hypothetical protein